MKSANDDNGNTDIPRIQKSTQNTLENMQKCAGANEKKKIEQNNFNPSEIY